MEDQDGSCGHGLGTLGSRDLLVVPSAHVVKLEQTSAWVEAWVQKLQTLTDQVETWALPKLGSFKRKDAQDDNNITTRKQLKLPKSKGKNVACFLCYQNHFSMDCPLKKKLEDLEEVQVQPILKVKPTTLGAIPSATYFKGKHWRFGCLDNRFGKVHGRRS
jgi:hypothetical protein